MTPFSADQLLRRLQALPDTARYAVAYSGGLDSHVLLHALHALGPALGAELRALHIDHGLHSRSGDWARHCEAIGRLLGLSVQRIDVAAAPAPGESPEAAAREARYAALRQQLREGEILLTAHHLDDQAETLLLQLLRGAGPAGLAAMPNCQPFGAGHLARPLLGFTREALREYADAQALVWIEDPSNAEREYDRNFLRHAVLPHLAARWPAFAATLGRAAGHQADAAELLEEMGALDLRHAATGERALAISALRTLSTARQRNLLRHWIRGQRLRVPDTRQLEAIRLEVAGARPDAQPRVVWPGGEVRRYRDALYALADAPPEGLSGVYTWADPARPLDIPALGRLQLAPAAAGLCAEALAGAPLTVRFRQGGERCRVPGRGGSRSLKGLLQEWGVPPWRRGRIPLLYIGDELAAVVGHCLCEPFVAPAGSDALMPHLLPREHEQDAGDLPRKG